MRWIGLDVHHHYIHATELDDCSHVKHYRIPMTETGLGELKTRLGPDAQVVVRLLDLYDVLTLLPETRQAYRIDTFTWQVYQLDRHTEAVMQATGLVFRLHAGATAARNRKNGCVDPSSRC
jgi:hypothetical protein